MRLDKFLKVSRLIKRRTVAKDVALANKIMVNNKLSKPSTILKIGDIITITILNNTTKVKVISLRTSSKKEDSNLMYEIIN